VLVDVFLQAVMVGNRLPANLDLIHLAQTESNRIYVIVEGHGRGTGPPVVPGTTRRPPRGQRASVTFTSGRSYLRLPQWSPGRRGRVEFNFRTIQRHGVMMVSSTVDERSDFFAVELSDGDLYVLFNLGGETQRFLIATAVNDGQAHHVVIERTGSRSLSFTVDGEQTVARLASGDDGSLDLGSTFFVGGTSNPERLPWLLYARMRDFYRGCIWDLRFDGGEVVELDQLRIDQGMFLMNGGCSPMPSYCSRTSCEHGGICRERWAGQLCYCALTAYTDRRCHRGLSTTPSVRPSDNCLL